MAESFKGIDLDAGLKTVVPHMSMAKEYGGALQHLQSVWDNLSLLGQLAGTGIDISNTRRAFSDLASDLLNQLGTEALKKCLLDAESKAQVAINILVRNLFERTADIAAKAAVPSSTAPAPETKAPSVASPTDSTYIAQQNIQSPTYEYALQPECCESQYPSCVDECAPSSEGHTCYADVDFMFLRTHVTEGTVVGKIAEKAIDRVNRHGGIDELAIAGAFAGVITRAAVGARQRVLFHVLPPRCLVVAGLCQGKPRLDVLPGRTGLSRAHRRRRSPQGSRRSAARTVQAVSAHRKPIYYDVARKCRTN